MPLYDHRCPEGHLFEVFGKFEAKTIPCRVDDCALPAERILVSLSGVGEYRAQSIEPVVVHQAKDGTYRLPGAADAHVPDGYQKVELRTIPEIQRFERAMNTQLRVEAEQVHERRHGITEAELKERHAALRQEMAHMTPFGRDFARLAIERANHGRVRNTDPGFYVEALHFNQSNQEVHRDERTDWRPRRV